ncbi:MAG: hypothetical protein H7A54_04420 [Akkermansiaceae bacterium]|nr:hypothetical protein [Akkermansiaceae bacterium]
MQIGIARPTPWLATHGSPAAPDWNNTLTMPLPGHRRPTAIEYADWVRLDEPQRVPQNWT